jgi:long-chain acyl-CoA synthetase
MSTASAPRGIRDSMPAPGGVRDPTSAPRSLRDLIEREAAAQPDAVYAVATEGGEALTYEALAASCREVGALLRRHGVGPGDTVALVLPNGLQTLRLLLGAMHAGVAVNPVNLLAQPEAMAYVLEHSDCRLVFVDAEREASVRTIVAALTRPVAVIVTEADAPALPRGGLRRKNVPVGESVAVGEGDPSGESESPHSPAIESAAVDPDAVALLMYTSGTTGRPKGVMLTQANLAANAISIAAEHALGRGDRVLAVLPLYHINAFAVTMLAPLASGGSLAMAPRFSAARFWGQAEAAGCTWINVVPTMISYLLEGQTPARESTARLRFCRSASAALPPEHLSAFETRFGIGVIETMGLTETVAPAFSNPLDPALRKLGSVGRASGCEARVIDAHFAPLADGVTGEIAIRGPNVMRGYYKDEAATRAAFTPDGWLRTGDLGHRDADGFFFVTGRIKELIIKGGENIAPREIDEALLGHPAVLEAAAVGVPDRHYGQEIMACIVVRPGHVCSEADLRAFAEMRLGRYKTPKLFRFVEALPRGPSGKVQRLKLLDLP